MRHLFYDTSRTHEGRPRIPYAGRNRATDEANHTRVTALTRLHLCMAGAAREAHRYHRV